MPKKVGVKRDTEATSTENFNVTHPELERGEVFVTNLDNILFLKNVGWKTKRVGKVAYNHQGKPLPGLVPVFAQMAEIEANN